MPDTASEFPAAATGRTGPSLVGAGRRAFLGSAGFLDDPASRADLEVYLADLTRPYPENRRPTDDAGPADDAGLAGSAAPVAGHSYGEMAEALIRTVVPADRPVGLLVLAYAIHDLQPGRATATYLSSVCPGTPLSFAISDQGSAAAFSGLRIVRDYLASGASGASGAAGAGGAAAAGASGAGGRALLIVVEQAGLPYPATGARPAEHRGLAMLFDSGAADDPDGVAAGATGRLVGLRQRPNVAAGALAGQVAADLAELSAGYRRVRVVASRALADAWPDRPEELRIGPAGQPSTGVWWQLLDEFAPPAAPLDPRPDLLVAADYDPELGYLCLAGFDAGFDVGFDAGSDAGSGLAG